MILKCGREEFEVNSEDIVKFNGSCYQLVTRKNGSGWHSVNAQIAKSKAEKMIKNGELVLVKKEKSPYFNIEIEYYKFNV